MRLVEASSQRRGVRQRGSFIVLASVDFAITGSNHVPFQVIAQGMAASGMPRDILEYRNRHFHTRESESRNNVEPSHHSATAQSAKLIM